MLLTVLGTDKRQKYLSEEFSKDFDVYYADENQSNKIVFDYINRADIIILPIPFTRDDVYINTTQIRINDFFKLANENALLYGGACKAYTYEHKKLFDYNENEDFLKYNAILTAESTVALAALKSPYAVKDSSVLILGNGRIGKCCSRLLKPYECTITVSARRSKDFEYIKSEGNNPINSAEISDLSQYDIIINTIPANIISVKTLNTKKTEALIIDLASKFSRLDCEKNYIDATSLPGKYSPRASSKFLFSVIQKHIREEAL